MSQRRPSPAWIVLAAAATMVCTAMGVFFSLGVFLKPIADSTGWLACCAFGERVMGGAYGAVFLVSTLGMGLGSWVGGAIYDHLGSYAWMFAGSFSIGAMAFVLAFTFRPPHPSAAFASEVLRAV